MENNSPHLKSAEYHRQEAKGAFNRQGETNVGTGEYIRLRSIQDRHTQAAHAAERAHAEATGQTLEYDHGDNPIFRPKRSY